MRMKLVVVGAGYAGTEVIRQLIMRGAKDLEIELISNGRNFENIISGPELISEKLKVEELTFDLKTLSTYWNFDLTVGSVQRIDLNKKKVKINKREKDYDLLVMAAGAEPNYFGISGTDLAQCAYHLPDFKIINENLKQLSSDNPKVAIVGAGCIGLEVAAEMLDLFKAMNKKVNITVVEKMNTVIPAYNNDAARKIMYEYFTSRGVRIKLGNGVKQVKKEELVLNDGSTIETDFTVWTAGIKSTGIVSGVTGANPHKGYIEVDERLLIKGREDAFATGDIASVEIGGKMAAKMAGEALDEARTVAKNIGRGVHNSLFISLGCKLFLWKLLSSLGFS